jgi:5-(carboxyamino)imidazole ribonucleotide mutase
MSVVAIVMGSKSDYEVVSKAKLILSEFGVESDVMIMSAHRTPDLVTEFSRSAKEKGYKIIIAAAGKAAHLAGFIAANTILPVIGLPMKSSTLDGMDSLLSTVQMPTGIPVATVAINGAENAALLALEILALSDAGLAKEMEEYRVRLREAVENDNKKING